MAAQAAAGGGGLFAFWRLSVPWRIDKIGNEYCVIRETNGEREGCHPTRREALAQQAALYAAEGKSVEAVNINDVIAEIYRLIDKRLIQL